MMELYCILLSLCCLGCALICLKLNKKIDDINRRLDFSDLILGETK